MTANTPEHQTLTESQIAGQDRGDDAKHSSSGIIRAAGVNSLGNIASRVLGLVREALVSNRFGASGATSAFDAASGVPKMLYELLMGGMLSAAIVPILSEYATERADTPRDAHGQTELEKVLSILLTLSGIVFVVVVVILELSAPWIASLLVGGFDTGLLATTTHFIRIMGPSILIYGVSGMLQAFHYARKQFVYPAFGGSAHNFGIIVTVLLLASRLDVASRAVGVLIAATLQLLMQLGGLRDIRLRLRFDWHHPVIRRILTLYAPVVVSIVISNLGIIVDRNLASRTVQEAITWMAKATYLIQLPLGLVSMAISLAVLPTLSQIDAAVDIDRFKRTFSQGLRLVIVTIIPAVVGMYALGEPIIRLVFEHGAFTSTDTSQTWHALRLYLIGMPFSAIDLPLVFAFYAQKNTMTPVMVGIVAVMVYLVVGPTLAFVAGWGYLGLVAANSVQLTSHALLMLLFFRRRFHGLAGYGVLEALEKTAVASLFVGLPAYGCRLLMEMIFSTSGFVAKALLVAICSAVGALGYVVGARLMRIAELNRLIAMVRQRLWKNATP